MLFTRTVNCWFCHHETKVSIFKTNSWTCDSCNQYNGFKRDGDYNKSINEMQQETDNKKTFCVNSKLNKNNGATSTSENSSANLLCEKCNKNQEIKIEKLANFEAKDDNQYEREYQKYKLKLEEIYDLCKQCKTKLKQHLQTLDLHVGAYNTQQSKTVAPATTNTNNNTAIATAGRNFQSLKTSIVNGCNQIKNGIYTNRVAAKAHTIAGVVPSSPSYKFNKNTEQHANEKFKLQTDQSNVNEENKSNDNAKEKKVTTKNSKKSESTKTYFYLIASDILMFICIICIFLGDLTNIFSDSGKLDIHTDNKFFLAYKYSCHILIACICLSFVLFIIRPKISRLWIIAGMSTCAFIHMPSEVERAHAEDQYILELLSSFLLSTFLLIARLYNLMQAIAYIKNKSQQFNNSIAQKSENNLSESLNESLINGENKLDKSNSSPPQQQEQPQQQQLRHDLFQKVSTASPLKTLNHNNNIKSKYDGADNNKENSGSVYLRKSVKINGNENSRLVDLTPSKMEAHLKFHTNSHGQQTPPLMKKNLNFNNESPMQVDESLNENDFISNSENLNYKTSAPAAMNFQNSANSSSNVNTLKPFATSNANKSSKIPTLLKNNQ